MSSTSPSASLSTQCGNNESSNSLANVVLSTVIVTVLVLVSSALLAHYFWRKWRQQKEKHLMLETDLEKGGKDQFAFDNPCFKESLTLTPVNLQQQQQQQQPQTNGSHNNIGNGLSSVQLTTSSSTATPTTTTSNGTSRLQHSKSVSKWTQWSPFNFNNECDKKRAFDDSFLDNQGTQTVSLRSDDFTGLGFNICGNIRDGIFIKDLLHHGPASKSGKICVGDRIKKVNINFENMVFEDALTILSYASPYAVDIEIESLSGRQHNLDKDRNMTQSQEPAHPKFKSSSISDLTKIQQIITSPNTKTQQKSSTLKLISAANASMASKTSTDVTDSGPKRKKSDDFSLLQKSEQKLKKIGAVLVFPKLKEQFRFNCGTSTNQSKNEPVTQPSAANVVEREENQNNENYEIECSTTVDEPKFPKRTKSRAPQPPMPQPSQTVTVDEPPPPKCRRTASLSDLSKVIDFSMLKSTSATISSSRLRPTIAVEKSKSICDFFEPPNFLSIQPANFNDGFSSVGQHNYSPDTIGTLRKAAVWGNLEDAVLSSLNDTNGHVLGAGESQTFSLCDKLDRRISKSPILPKHLAVLEQVSLTASEDDDRLSFTSTTADNQSAISVETLVDEPRAPKLTNGNGDHDESHAFKTFGNLENPKSNVLKNVNKIKRLLSSASSLNGFQAANESGSLAAGQS